MNVNIILLSTIIMVAGICYSSSEGIQDLEDTGRQEPQGISDEATSKATPNRMAILNSFVNDIFERIHDK